MKCLLAVYFSYAGNELLWEPPLLRKQRETDKSIKQSSKQWHSENDNKMKKRCELSVGCVLLLRIELHAIRGAAIAKNREKSTCIRITDTLKTNKTK